MPDQSTEPELVTLEPMTVAVIREIVPMNALPDFFGRAFHAAAAASAEQGVAIAGPPLGAYYSMPTDTVDVAAGFPTDGAVGAAGDVISVTLPGGRAAQILHVGSYDSLIDTYGRLMAWLEENGLTGGPLMWESYLNEPDPADVESTLTRITWPLAP